MKVQSKLWHLLSEDEQALLETHFSLLNGLADGSVEPQTPNQRRFVEACARNFSTAQGRSEKAWHKYLIIKSTEEECQGAIQALEKEVLELKNTNIELSKEIESCKNVSEALSAVIKAHSLYIGLLEPALTCTRDHVWNDDVLNKLPREDKAMLLQYAKLFVLREEQIISAEAFEQFCNDTGLWKAVHNYKKLLSPPKLKATTGSAAGELCPSCGGPVNNGHCRCVD